MTKIQITQTDKVLEIGYSDFEFVSDFDIHLPAGRQEFRIFT
jgi:hypothetical protein